MIKQKRCSILSLEIIDKMWGGVKTSSIKSRYTTTRLSFLYYIPVLNLKYVFLLFKKKRTNIFVCIYVMIGILLAILLIYFFLSLSFVKVHIFWEGHKILQISTLLLTGTTYGKSKVKISQNFEAFSEYRNFTFTDCLLRGLCTFTIINWLRSRS